LRRERKRKEVEELKELQRVREENFKTTRTI
jgi:hypothetical protein